MAGKVDIFFYTMLGTNNISRKVRTSALVELYAEKKQIDLKRTDRAIATTTNSTPSGTRAKLPSVSIVHEQVPLIPIWLVCWQDSLSLECYSDDVSVEFTDTAKIVHPTIAHWCCQAKIIAFSSEILHA